MSDTAISQPPARADVVIIGGGIAGVATAWYLARKGLHAVVCEKGRIAGEQSGRNWGFVRQQGRDPAEIPLMMTANAIWRGLERELNADLEWRAGGNLVIFRSEEDRILFEKWMPHAKACGLDSQMLGPREIQRLAPGVTIGRWGGIYTPGDGQAEPTLVSKALARGAVGRGAEVIENCAVLHVNRQGGRVSGVVTERGEIRADTVVLAAGAWSSKMMKHLGLDFPQIWVLGSVGLTAPAAKISDAAIWAGVAFRQRRDGRINFARRSAHADLTVQSLLHARAFLKLGQDYRRDFSLRVRKILFDTAFGHFSERALQAELRRYRVLDPKPSRAAIRDGLAELKTAFPALAETPLQSTWAGYIEMTPDLLPVLEAVDNPAGLIVATGFSGHGFGMGPVVGKLVGELAAGEAPSHDLTPFRFGRFGDGSLTRPETAI